MPVIGLNYVGRHPLDLCIFNKNNATGLESINSCSVTRDGAQYFNSGKWKSSGALFTMEKTTDNLFVKVRVLVLNTTKLDICKKGNK